MIPQLYASEPSGWTLVEQERTEGVPYELLLAQRFVGGTWLAHRNHTSTKLNDAIAATVEEMLGDAGFVVLRSSRNGGETPPSRMEEITGTDSRIGIAVLKGRRASYAVVFATARDQGSANKSGASLLKMARPPELPVALVLTGPGCACTFGDACTHTRTRLDPRHPDIPYQNDYLFASAELATHLTSCRALATNDWFSVSDHAPIVADFDLA